MFSSMFVDCIYEVILVGMARLHSRKGLLSALLEKEIVDIPSLLGSIRIDKGLDRIQFRRHIWLHIFHCEGISDLIGRILMFLEANNRSLRYHKSIGLPVFLQGRYIHCHLFIIGIHFDNGCAIVNCNIRMLRRRRLDILVKGEGHGQFLAGDICHSVFRTDRQYFRSCHRFLHHWRVFGTTCQKQSESQKS